VFEFFYSSETGWHYLQVHRQVSLFEISDGDINDEPLLKIWLVIMLCPPTKIASLVPLPPSFNYVAVE
jgi:hypothetical protein